MTSSDHLNSSQPTAHQRRPEYARDDDWIRNFLRRGEIAHIATQRDGQPWVTPTTYYFDENGRRIIFHSNIAGRLRTNIEHNSRVCAEVSEMGRLMPSNVALEFSLQYRSVMLFGTAHVLTDPAEQTQVMHHLIAKYFGRMEVGKDYRPVSKKELKRVSVYELKIEAWSGKENWKERAIQTDEWPALDERWLGSE